MTGFKTARTLDFVLIGHLGKRIEVKEDGQSISSDISGNEILDKAFEVIRSAVELIPCRCVLVECNYEPKVNQFYKDYGFSFFQNDGSHNQYTMLL